ncbi:MAG: FAD-dependent oxidoreductase [Actinomyces sp.]|nr:FAD-dependent oxidoreductase [Actinomyces sp.]
MNDAIVIGSGIGALTTAGLLAGVAGARVLVLEKHCTPGGLTHSFRRMGASWDVGLHYVGDMHPGSRPRQLFDYLTGGALTWNRMPSGYDRFVLPGHGLDVTIPSGIAHYRALLTDLFPAERRAIRRYCRDVTRAYSWMSLRYMADMVPPLASPAINLALRLRTGCALERTEHYMERRFRDPALRALLTTHWGDYGVEPARSAFVAHAMIVCHYMDGAWFPRGGSGQIARMIEERIRATGGEIRLCQDVDDILIDNGRAVGVRVTDRRSVPVSYEERAPIVISGVGARETYTRLLPTTGPVGALTARVRDRIAHLGHGGSAATVYLTLDHYPADVDGSNVWVNTSQGPDDLEQMTEDLCQGRPQSAFISFPGIKAGDRHATAEIVSFAQPEAFDRWSGTRPGMRGEDYERMTSAMARGLIDLADTAIPGLKDAVRSVEVATPLTIEHFTSHESGCFYGLPLTPERFAADLSSPSTPINGLYLTGQDAGMPGIVGSALAGMAAACTVLGPAGYPRIMRALRDQVPTQDHAVSSRDTTSERTAGATRHRATVQHARWMSPTTRDITLELPECTTWEAGQYALVRVAPFEWRPYSLASAPGRTVRLLVDVRTKGLGASWASTIAPGDDVDLELPYGHWLVTTDNDTTEAEAPHRRIFIATGTGIAPFLATFELDRRDDDILIVGCSRTEDVLTSQVDTPLPRLIRCVSREAAPDAFHGRITDYLNAEGIDPQATYYVCGSAHIVRDISRIIQAGGARVSYETF